MQLTLKRTAFGDVATEGQLSVNGNPECVTLEPKHREVAGEPVASWKVDGHTAIPAGVYSVTTSMSGKFGCMMPLLNNVPGFSEVRIHPGNTDRDTEGCILLGETIVNGDFIGSSRVAFDHFFPQLEAALAAGETCVITVG